MPNLILREIVVERPTGLFFEANANIVSSQGTIPFHRHTCIADGNRGEHVWLCNSPYCTVLNSVCPDHGGREPVRVGEEPWRGR